MSMLNVGDAVLYMKSYGARPFAGNVHKATKTQVRVTLVDGTEVGPFKREAFNGQHETIKSGSDQNYSAVWAKTDEVEKNLNDAADKAEKAAAEKKDAEAKRQQEYAERLAADLAEVKAACGFTCATSPINPKVIKNVMPDGSRIYTIDMPVKPCHAERKAGWERVIVRCKAAEYWDFRADVQKKGVESAYTYINGNSYSFASCSSCRSETDEDAVWEAIRSCYNSGW